MSRLSRNIIYNISGQGIILILSFVSIRYIFNRLGEDALGIIYFTATINAMLYAVLNMGIASTTVREVSGHFGSEPEYVKSLIRTFSSFYWIAYMLIGIAVFFLAPVLVERWINLKSMDAATATYMLRVLGITSALALPNSLYDSLFRGLQRMEVPNVISVATIGLQQFGTVLLLAFGGNVFQVSCWFAGCYVLKLLISVLAAGRFFSARALIPGFSTEVFRRNLGFASRMMSISVIATVHRHADKLIISKLLPIGTVGYYGVAYINVSKGQLLTGAVSQAAYPSFSALFEAGDRAGLMSQYRKLQDLICFGIVPIFAAIPFAVLPLFSYLINEEAARMLLLPVTFLCMGFYMNGTITVPYKMSLACGKPGISARLTFYALFVVLPVTVFLIYFLGLPGAGLSWIFYHIFSYFYAVPRICRECLEIRTWEWYRHLLRIFALIGLTYGTAWVALSVIGKYSISQLFTAYVAASMCYATGAYVLIGDELRGLLIRRLQPLASVVGGYYVRKEGPREP